MNPKDKSVPREKIKATLEQQQLNKIGRAFQTRRLDLSRRDGVLNWSYTALEEKSSVTSYTLSKIERGKLKNCSLLTLNQIASALGMTLEISIILKE